MLYNLDTLSDDTVSKHVPSGDLSDEGLVHNHKAPDLTAMVAHKK